jgi:TetR/AcrR family transcriptional regulator, transcriptional repressor for nem operon
MPRSTPIQKAAAPTLTKKEATHERIVAAASRSLRRSGFNGVNVAEVMKDAGLTHGGFYAHFKSRDALLAEAIDRAARDIRAELSIELAKRRVITFRDFVESYLDDSKLTSFEKSCPVASLSSDLARYCSSDTAHPYLPLQHSARHLVEQLIAGVQKVLPPGTDNDAAPSIASTLVGALQLARTLGDGPQAKAVLTSARSTLIAQYDTKAN